MTNLIEWQRYMAAKGAMFLFFLLLSGGFQGNAQAEQYAPSAPGVPVALLDKVNLALKSLPVQIGRFEQVLPNGTKAGGRYHMQWPARLRFAYTHTQSGADGGSIVTVRDKFVAVQETQRAQPNWFPVSLTPLAVLRAAAQNGISQDMVLSFQDEAVFLSLELHDPSGALPGVATLYFTKDDFRLYAWRLVDVQNLVTQVRLFPEAFPSRLSERLFDIDYDDDFEDE